MKNKNLIILLLLIGLFSPQNIISQINCKPASGDKFKPISKDVNLRMDANLNAKVALKSPNPDDVWFECKESGFINDFVKIEIRFITGAFEEKGVNPNILYLYDYLKSEYYFKFNFQEFYEITNDSQKLNEIYILLFNDENNEWFNNWTEEEYDVSSYEKFYDYWIKFDKSKSDFNYIFDNHEKNFYVHKSQITNQNLPFIMELPNGSTKEEYLDKIEKYVELKREENCNFTEDVLYSYFERYIELILEEDPFLAIKEINRYSEFFFSKVYKFKIDFLKMKASYKDENYENTIDLGKKILVAYKNKTITNTKEKHFQDGDIDMSDVYGHLISSLLTKNRFQEALILSNESLNNRNLKFDQSLIFHTLILIKLNRTDEACKLLNKEYLNGNEDAREILNKYCN